jgi:hypothetical protein
VCFCPRPKGLEQAPCLHMHDVRELYSTLNKDPCRVRAYCASPGPESPPARSATHQPHHTSSSRTPRLQPRIACRELRGPGFLPIPPITYSPQCKRSSPRTGRICMWVALSGPNAAGPGTSRRFFLLPGSSDCWMRWYANWDKNRPPLHIYPKSGSALTYVSAQPRLRAAIFSCLTEEHSRFVG